MPDISKGVLEIKADVSEELDDGSWFMQGNVRLVLNGTEVTADTVSYSTKTGDLEATGSVLILQGASSITADRIFFSAKGESDQEPRLTENGVSPEEPSKKGGTFVGENFHLIEPRRELHTEYIEYDLANQTGKVLHAHGRLGSLYFGAETLEILGPEHAIGENVWVTTCDLPTPHYRIHLKQASALGGTMVLGTNAQLQLGKVGTPFFVPKWRSGEGKERNQFTFDFDSGRLAEIGYFLNVGVWTPLTPNTDLALRVMPTQKEGVGFGLDLTYDLMMKPASPFFRSKGSLNTMYTTQDRGYTHFYHRQELTPKTVLLAQTEQWYDEDFVKDFFYDTYRDRTGPRTFVNITRTAPGIILSTTVAPSTHGFTDETEKLPEVSFHLLEREVAPHLYLTFDSVSGYYERSDESLRSARTFNQMRLTYDINAGEGLNIAPFIEVDTAWYDKTLIDEDAEARVSGTAGITLQSRFHRNYKGALGFSAFRHIVVPSITYFYRPDASLNGDDTPQFDGLDSMPGRSRIETKLENIILGRDGETGESWQVARATFYQGFDFQNETRKTRDYEVEIDIRPRPWWGLQTVWENHSIERENDLLEYFPTYERLRELRDRLFARIGREDRIEQREGDFSRILSYLYYDDSQIRGRFNGRLGFAFTETDSEVFNREILYGAGYRISDKWGVAFEHRYDIERGDLARQTYEVRRRLHCWDAALQFRDRDSGFDINIEFSLAAFPGTKVKF